eukprot:jgi/Chrpa1/7841/Chrysochromulina_OHIO_Genome00015950-RA
MDRIEHARCYGKIYMVLIHDWDIAMAKMTLEAEWEYDAQGAETLSRVQLGDGLFEVADLWCHALRPAQASAGVGVAAAEYAHFLLNLLDRIATDSSPRVWLEGGVIAASVVEANAARPLWKPPAPPALAGGAELTRAGRHIQAEALRKQAVLSVQAGMRRRHAKQAASLRLAAVRLIQRRFLMWLEARRPRMGATSPPPPHGTPRRFDSPGTFRRREDAHEDAFRDASALAGAEGAAVILQARARGELARRQAEEARLEHHNASAKRFLCETVYHTSREEDRLHEGPTGVESGEDGASETHAKSQELCNELCNQPTDVLLHSPIS